MNGPTTARLLCQHSAAAPSCAVLAMARLVVGAARLGSSRLCTLPPPGSTFASTGRDKVPPLCPCAVVATQSVATLTWRNVLADTACQRSLRVRARDATHDPQHLNVLLRNVKVTAKGDVLVFLPDATEVGKAAPRRAVSGHGKRVRFGVQPRGVR